MDGIAIWQYYTCTYSGTKWYAILEYVHVYVHVYSYHGMGHTKMVLEYVLEYHGTIYILVRTIGPLVRF